MTLIRLDKDSAKTVVTSPGTSLVTALQLDMSPESSPGKPSITNWHIILHHVNISIIDSFWSHMHAEHVGPSYASRKDTWNYTYMCVSEDF